MAFAFRVTCDGCPYESEIIWPLWACYQWPSGRTLELAQRISWCNGCRSVTVGESVTELGQIDRLRALPVLEDVYKRGPIIWSADEKEAVLTYARYPRFANLYEHLIYWKRWGVNQYVIMKETLKLHREWRLARTSPPRCLECGCTDFVPLAVDGEGAPRSDTHPGCGGMFTFVRARKALRQKIGLWTIEGERIGVG